MQLYILQSWLQKQTEGSTGLFRGTLFLNYISFLNVNYISPPHA